MKFSANLGFLWNDRTLPDAIRAAKAAGFDAVECHWPYEVPTDDVNAALKETGFKMLGLNTRRGDLGRKQNGLAALPDEVDNARAAIEEAVEYAAATGTGAVHVMAGFAEGPEARKTFLANLGHASALAAPHGITILMEPLNRYDAPGYFLTTTTQARALIEDLGATNVKLMFDCYHVQLMEGDLTHRLKALMPIIGHIQFASAPDRGPPDDGELDFGYVFRVIEDLGYAAPLGAEYKPVGDTDATLGWLRRFGTT